MNNPSIDADGDKFWYNDVGDLHRTDGPAIIDADGGKEWFINDKRHRDDGPAIIDADGDKYWYINDRRLSENQFDIYRKSLDNILRI